MGRSLPTFFLVLCSLASASATLAGDLQDQLNASWRGAWAVLLLETASTCDSSYTNNKVLVTRTLSTAPHRLPAGELGRVQKVDVKRSRIDILIDIDEPLLVSSTDGPYQLFDQLRCRVELEIEVPREWVKGKRVTEIGQLLSGTLERHHDQQSVTASERWNRREVEPLPEGYDEILLEYRAWKAKQLEGELLSTMDKALREAQRALDRADDDPAYGAGLAAGMEKEADRSRSRDDCEKLADESFYPASKGPPAAFEGSGKKQWKQGYRDGQVVAFSVELARQITRCLGELKAGR